MYSSLEGTKNSKMEVEEGLSSKPNNRADRLRRNPLRVANWRNLVTRLFTSYRKLLYDCDIYLLQKKSFLATTKRRNQILELRLKLESTGEMKWNENDEILYGLAQFFWTSNLSSLVPTRNCLRCHFRGLFVSLTFRKCEGL